MQIPPLLANIPPKIRLAAGGLFAVVVAGLIVLAVSGGGDEGGSGPRPTPVTAQGPDVGPSPTATVEATPTQAPAPNRQDCAAIRGTPYQSDEEQAWFSANCGSFDQPSVPAPSSAAQVSIGDRLIIGSAGVNTEVYRATVPSTGQMPDPAGYFNAVWYDFGNWPGLGGYVNAGNMVLSGHVDCARCVSGGPGTAVFWSVRNLKPGDTAEYRTADGRSFSYVVTESRSVSPSTDFTNIVASSTADLTLITCTGTFSGGEYTQRHVVSMKKV
jgi:hypothetical protein